MRNGEGRVADGAGRVSLTDTLDRAPLTGVLRFGMRYLLTVGVAGWLFLLWYKTWFALRLVKEDSLTEWMAFFLLVVSMVLWAWAAVRWPRGLGLTRVALAILALSGFVLAMEEISWGQRVLGFETPAGYAEINVQNETSLHNLEGLQRVRHLALVVFGVAGLVVIGDRKCGGWITRWFGFVRDLSPPVWFWHAFFWVMLTGVVTELTEWRILYRDDEPARLYRFYAGRFTEIGELIVAIAAVSHAWLACSAVRRNGWGGRREMLREAMVAD